MQYNVLIADIGAANLASVFAALDKIKLTYTLSRDAREVEKASHVLVPGVGHFGAAMHFLKEHRLDQALINRVQQQQPTMGICVGMQVFFQASQESEHSQGLDCVHASLTRFSTRVRVPQLGWNQIQAHTQSRYLTSGYAYFANSYRAIQASQPWIISTADYDGTFVAAVEYQSLLLCQFHPELSGPWGLQTIQRWFDLNQKVGAV